MGTHPIFESDFDCLTDGFSSVRGLGDFGQFRSRGQFQEGTRYQGRTTQEQQKVQKTEKQAY